MSRCQRPAAPTVSPSAFDLFVSSEMNQINSMLNAGQKVLNELERGQMTPKRGCSRGGTCPKQRNLLSPSPPACVFSPKQRESAIIGSLADRAANMIVENLMARNALIPDLSPSTPPRGIQRHPAQLDDNLMAFEDASPVMPRAPHSAARRYLNRPPDRAMLYPKANLFGGTPTPVAGKWISHGRSRKVFVPDGSSMPRLPNRRLDYSSQDLNRMPSPSFPTKRIVTFRPSIESVRELNKTFPQVRSPSRRQRPGLSHSFGSESPRFNHQKTSSPRRFPLTETEQSMMSACSNFIAQVQAIEESDVMSDSFKEMEEQFAREDQTLYERLRSKAVQHMQENPEPESAVGFASKFASGNENLNDISLQLVDDNDDNVPMGRLIDL